MPTIWGADWDNIWCSWLLSHIEETPTPVVHEQTTCKTWGINYNRNNVNNFVLISNILFNSFINSTANYGLLSEITLSSSPCNFYTLSLNNHAKSSADVLSVVATKCAILDNLSQTIRITSFPATNSNLVMKSTIKCVYSFSGTSFTINFPASASIWFFIF